MSLDKSRLTEFLEVIDSELEETITLVAAGGTAMTLLGIKPSTIDVDFTGPAKSLDKLKAVLARLRPGFRVDYWPDGMVFSQTLPGDYLQKSIPIRTGFKHIELRALQPLDIVVTKIGRLNERDWQDIEQSIKKFGITSSQIKRRAAQVEYAGNEEIYRSNARSVIARFFQEPR